MKKDEKPALRHFKRMATLLKDINFQVEEPCGLG